MTARDIALSKQFYTELSFTVNVPGKLNRYRFGQKITDSLVCSDCGIYVGAMMTAEDYAAESAEQRVARRLALWTPVRTIA